MQDILTWGAVIGAGGSVVALIRFWMDRATAESAAEEAKESAASAHQRITALDAAFGIYREHIARDYVSRDLLREMEDRITTSINRLGDRLDRIIEQTK